MLSKLADSTQTITFSEGDGVCSADVFANEVVVSTNAGNHNHGSSKVKLKNLVDYNWEPKFYAGQLLAIHINGNYLAYSIKAPNVMNPGSWCGMVRVVYNPEPGVDRRTLIKGMKGEVQDLAFAHKRNQVILACIDEQGNFYVHEIESTETGLKCSLLAEVREDSGVGVGATHRVVWCPYIPDEEDDEMDDDVSKLLLTTNGNIGRMWNVRVVESMVEGAERRGSVSSLCGGSAGCGVVAAEHAGALVHAAFSPDGTALATASADGYVMFFQVYMSNESSPRCLHKWQPHGGKPVSCLFFLDNHKTYNTDVQFWKFAVTGADSNTCIKIWSCMSWNCLQTVSFIPSPGIDPAVLGLKAMLDTSASYLILSDFKARSLYVLNMARDRDDTMAYCKSISEFLLPYPVLSFCIADAEEAVSKCESRCDDPFHRNGSVGDTSATPTDFEVHHNEVSGASGTCSGGHMVRVKLYIVQPKGLQEGELLYAHTNHTQSALQGLSNLSLEEPPAAASAPVASSILEERSRQLKNLLMRSQTQPGSLITQRPESPQLNLMTPDAFSSPGKREDDDPPLSATPDVTSKPRSSTSGVAEQDIGIAECEPTKLTSGGSSPSREVQQIMAHDAPYYKNHMDEDDEEDEEENTSEREVEAAVIVDGGASFDSLPRPALPSPPLAPPSAPLPPSAPPATTAPPAPPALPQSNDTSWPQISLAQITEANQRKASSDKSSSQSLNNSLNVASLERPPSEEPRPCGGLSSADKSRLEALDLKLEKLTEVLVAQSREIRALRTEMQSPHETVESALHAHTQRTTAAIDAALTTGWERVARVGEACGTRAAQAAGAGAARALEPLAVALQQELASKLSATDQLLRDNIEKLANSKTIMERLSTSIAKSLADMVRDSFREALFDSVLPVMEKAHAQLFRQINQAFQNGTKEFACNTEAAARAAAERGGAAAAAGLRAALDRHADVLRASVAQQPVTSHPPRLDPAPIKELVHSVLQKELTWWREQALASRAHSPSTPAVSAASAAGDRQMQVAQIQSLMGAGDVNGAFQLALSASDLSLVMAACRAADPGLVFAPPCALKQHVLLSLVQQLAADMQRDTHLKQRYLEEAVMNLDTTNPVTREHLPVVIRELQKQIVNFINTNHGHALTRQFKMLLMATESLVKSSV